MMLVGLIYKYKNNYWSDLLCCWSVRRNDV